jgi:hypothetical protein
MSQTKNLVDAINAFIVGCKADGIWDPIKACCIMAAWDGLNGALVPLKGTAPTNFNFVSGDYNRKTGLVGDGSTKYLDSNRNNNADPQDNNHNAVYVSAVGNSLAYAMGTGTSGGLNQMRLNGVVRNRNTTTTDGETINAPTFYGANRSSGSEVIRRLNSSSATFSISSLSPASGSIIIFGRSIPPDSTARLAFYSIGEAVNLAQLDTRVSNLMTAIGAAIP